MRVAACSLHDSDAARMGNEEVARMSVAGLSDHEPVINVRDSCVERNVLDVDGYERTVAGVRIEGVRTGRGRGPNHVLAVSNDQFTLSSCEVGFPMRNRTTLGDGQVILAHIDEGVPGSQWCEIGLETGSLIAYGPGAEHTAVNLPGLKFTFVATDVDRLSRIADDAGIVLDLPPRGEVVQLERSVRTSHIGTAFRTFAEAAQRRTEAANKAGMAVLPALINGFGLEGRRRCGGPRRSGIDSRHVVHQCLDYADVTQSIPSIPELCLVASVS